MRDYPLNIALLNKECNIRLQKHVLSPMFVLHGKRLGNGYVYSDSFLDWWNVRSVEKKVLKIYVRLGFSSFGKIVIYNNKFYERRYWECVEEGTYYVYYREYS